MLRSPVSNPSKILVEVKSFLDSFKSSQHKFALLNLSASTQKDSKSDHTPVRTGPKTLFILDSSYNPPSRAHFTLACSALTSPAASKHPKPHGLILLFSTANADKAPSPASFEQRLAMMRCLASDISSALSQHNLSDINVDIGVTTEPYYVGKSLAIEDARAYEGKPKHVHIIGYDTVTRLLAPKYYPEYDPPLSALEPYFGAGHAVLVALRPESSSANMRDAGGQAVREQRAYVDGLREGALRDTGFQAQWAEQVSVLEGEELRDAVGISSTAIRDAAKKGDSEALETLCTPSVADWVVDQKLYLNEASS